MGISRTVMLTGDLKNVGEAVGAELGVDEVKSELLPGDKVSAVEALLKEKKEGAALAFVGDGVNDAPVLARADVGVAMIPEGLYLLTSLALVAGVIRLANRKTLVHDMCRLWNSTIKNNWIKRSKS